MEGEALENPTDLFGRPIGVNDYVIGGQGNALNIYKVTKITPKMVRIVSINAKSRLALKGKLRYCNELAKIEEKLVTFYLMKQT